MKLIEDYADSEKEELDYELELDSKENCYVRSDLVEEEEQIISGCSSENEDVCQELLVDYSNEFTTYDILPNKEKLVERVRCTGRRLGFVIIILRPDMNDSRKMLRIFFGCERSGKFKELKSKKVAAKRRITGSKKCNCPFKLRATKFPNVDEWNLEVLNGVHNHAQLQNREGHSFAGRLSKKETKLVIDMHKNMVKAKEILHTLKQNDPKNCTTIKTIYNVIAAYNKSERAGRSQVQYLFCKLKEFGYFEWHRRTLDGTDIIKDIFWAHPTSLDFLHTFPRVIIMDCMYKTNRYKIPLLEIVGVTSTNHTFCIAITYLVGECEENYLWALERLKSIIMDCEVEMPRVIITDREIALINAIEKVFPQSTHLLCKWHIKNNVLTYIRKRVKNMTIEDTKSFLNDWNELVNSENLVLYNQNLQALHEKYGANTLLLKYIHENWLDIWKDRFVHAWTDEHMHFGNYTSNRAESAHAKLKKHLSTCQCNFEQACTKMHSLLELSFTELKAAFEKSLTKVVHVYHIREFKNLRGVISNMALELLHSELVLTKQVGVYKSFCICTIRKTHGLPCFHELAHLGPHSEIPLELIDIHWTGLHLIERVKKKDMCVFEKIEDLLTEVKKMDAPYQMQLYKKLVEVVVPQTSSLASPQSKVKTRGRDGKSKKINPSTKRMLSNFELVESISSHQQSTQLSSNQKKQKVEKLIIRRPKKVEELTVDTRTYIGQIPAEWTSFVTEICDVESDGNCGFRCVASMLGLGESCWAKVRNDLYEELNNNKDLYESVFVEKNRFDILLESLLFDDSGDAPPTKWMTMPDIGYVIATRYQVVVFNISTMLSLTIPPLRGKIPSPVQRLEFGIAFVNNVHFVRVKLKPDHPVPRIIARWFTCHRTDANGWENILKDRRQAWNDMFESATWD